MEKCERVGKSLGRGKYSITKARIGVSRTIFSSTPSETEVQQYVTQTHKNCFCSSAKRSWNWVQASGRARFFFLLSEYPRIYLVPASILYKVQRSIIQGDERVDVMFITSADVPLLPLYPFMACTSATLSFFKISLVQLPATELQKGYFRDRLIQKAYDSVLVAISFVYIVATSKN